MKDLIWFEKRSIEVAEVLDTKGQIHKIGF